MPASLSEICGDEFTFEVPLGHNTCVRFCCNLYGMEIQEVHHSPYAAIMQLR